MLYFKQHWPHLLVSLLASTFALGFGWAVLGDRVANAERRLDEINLAHVAQTRWQVDQDAVSIAAIRADARQTEAAVAQINTKLGVIDAKLDALTEAVKRK
jgi:Tfp pilus assembly protein PilO